MSTIDLTGISFAITGKGQVVFRDDLIQQIQGANGSIHAAVRAGTTFLLTGKSNRPQATRKSQDADKLGVTKVDIDDFVEWMRNPGNTSLPAASASISAINRARSASAPAKTKKASTAKIRKLFRGLAAIESPGIERIDF